LKEILGKIKVGNMPEETKGLRALVHQLEVLNKF
jgi:hypothetical protein